QYRYLFEPFNRLPICQKTLSCQLYLRPENKDREKIILAQSLLSGQIKDLSIDFRAIQQKKLIFEKRLIKAICANLFLKWLQVNFPGIPIILLIRHPCAVAISKIKRGWGKYDPGVFLKKRPELVADYLQPFQKEFEAANTNFEQYIFNWCINYYVPLKQFQPGEIHLAFYENFCENPRAEVDRLFRFLGTDYEENIFSKIQQPSSSVRKSSAVVTGQNLVNSWKKDITETQLARAMEILSLFDLDKIYDEQATPNLENAYKILAQS
ncbi:MAG: sulfotransferase domain-containing protein, partial [Oscillatoria sp. PMC 1076.18]|nr:sulfotransferase domain-containing protein [Oscillatoria sp. PMC 1076.18]